MPSNSRQNVHGATQTVNEKEQKFTECDDFASYRDRTTWLTLQRHIGSLDGFTPAERAAIDQALSDTKTRLIDGRPVAATFTLLGANVRSARVGTNRPKRLKGSSSSTRDRTVSKLMKRRLIRIVRVSKGGETTYAWNVEEVAAQGPLTFEQAAQLRRSVLLVVNREPPEQKQDREIRKLEAFDAALVKLICEREEFSYREAAEYVAKELHRLRQSIPGINMTVLTSLDRDRTKQARIDSWLIDRGLQDEYRVIPLSGRNSILITKLDLGKVERRVKDRLAWLRGARRVHGGGTVVREDKAIIQRTRLVHGRGVKAAYTLITKGEPATQKRDAQRDAHPPQAGVGLIRETPEVREGWEQSFANGRSNRGLTGTPRSNGRTIKSEPLEVCASQGPGQAMKDADWEQRFAQDEASRFDEMPEQPQPENEIEISHQPEIEPIAEAGTVEVVEPEVKTPTTGEADLTKAIPETLNCLDGDLPDTSASETLEEATTSAESDVGHLWKHLQPEGKRNMAQDMLCLLQAEQSGVRVLREVVQKTRSKKRKAKLHNCLADGSRTIGVRKLITASRRFGPAYQQA